MDTQRKEWPDDSSCLLNLGEIQSEQNFWNLTDAFQGTQIFGSTGSGKSSGSGAAIARAFLRSNLGGLVLTAKTDERRMWERYAKETNRTRDLLIFSDDKPHRFNFLKYESNRTDRGGANTENLVNLFWSMMEVADRKNGNGGEAYWARAVKQLLRNALDLMSLARAQVDLQDLYEIITSAPNSLAELEDPKWQKSSRCLELLLAAESLSAKQGREADYRMTASYWLREFAQLANETRTSIVNMFTSMTDGFLRGLMREMFCGESTFSPEDSFGGRIIILDFPVKQYHETGIFAQVLFKYIWQRAVERRIPETMTRDQIQDTIRPVFLWADESQFFVNDYDALFQSTARSSRACTVYLTQNLPGYQTALAASGGKSAADTFLANLQTKIAHANGDPQTNNWMADSIGRVRQLQMHSGIQQGESLRSASQNAGGSFAFEYSVQPQEFTQLATGGRENSNIVDAIIFQAGRSWLVNDKGREVTKNYIRHRFPQS